MARVTHQSHRTAVKSVVIIVADGVRPDTLEQALRDGAVPALSRLRSEGSLSTVTSVFPSVTGPAYAPFLMGRYPGPVGLVGLRWFDRARTVASRPHWCRSYVGAEMRHVDRDLDPGAPTMFELAPSSIGALNVIGRGLTRAGRLARSARFVLRAARTHFRGNVQGWLDVDRDVAEETAERIRRDRPAFAFCALTGVDKTSHAEGHDGPLVVEALRIVDGLVARIREDAERDGRWRDMQLWIVSDHGHSPVHAHEDLDATIRGWGWKTLAHPWAFRAKGRDVGVMVSGNAMAHLYLELAQRERPWWPQLGFRWSGLVDRLLALPSVDLALLPHGTDRCEVRSRERGSAVVEREHGHDGPRYSYRPRTGDPLGLGHLEHLSADDAYDATIDSDYPDALVQVSALAGSPRTGEIVLSAARGWDFRAKYEPIPHVSSHGALHREHMLVPVLTNAPVARAPRRTVDVMPSALDALGLDVPAGLDGESWLRERKRKEAVA
jgi:hypothetical protein